MPAPEEFAGTAPDRIRIVLADDHPQVLEAVSDLLVEEFDLLQSVSDGLTLIDVAAALKPDVVISDIQMSGLDGIEAGREILKRRLSKGVIVLTMYNEPHLVSRALEAGIRGFVLKVDAGEELIQAVRHVAAGGTYLSRAVRRFGP